MIVATNLTENMEERVKELLNRILHPETQHGLVESGFVEQVSTPGDKITVTLNFAKVRDPFALKIKRQVQALLEENFPALKGSITVIIKEAAPKKPQAADKPTMTGNIAHIVAIASGKGGVGKSTVTANLAVALRNRGFRVGILDADIYGPSQPKMFGLEGYLPEAEQVDGQDIILPAEAMDMKIMSIGFFVKPSDALLWRGAMAVNALRQMIHQTRWGALDFLLVDLPPGTGDIHLSIISELKIDTAVIVSTPPANRRGRRAARRGDVPQSAGEHPPGRHRRKHGLVHPGRVARKPLLPLRKGRRPPLRRGKRHRPVGRNTYHTVHYGRR